VVVVVVGVGVVEVGGEWYGRPGRHRPTRGKINI